MSRDMERGLVGGFAVLCLLALLVCAMVLSKLHPDDCASRGGVYIHGRGFLPVCVAGPQGSKERR
jgi:hypothetical protein